MCGTYNLCADVWAGIEGTVHVMGQTWDKQSDNVMCILLLVKERNTFNEVKHSAMLWNVWQSLALGVSFKFNTYWHWKMLVL